MTYIGAEQLLQRARAAAAEALTDAAAQVKVTAQSRVPIETGRLHDTARVAPATAERLRAKVEFTAAHAQAAHEGLPRDQPLRFDDPGRGEKFVESAFLEEVAKIQGRLAAKAREHF